MAKGRLHHELLSSSLYAVQFLGQKQNWVGRKMRRSLRHILPHLDSNRLLCFAVYSGISNVDRRDSCVRPVLAQNCRYHSIVPLNTMTYSQLVYEVDLLVDRASSAEFQPSPADLLHRILAGGMKQHYASKIVHSPTGLQVRRQMMLAFGSRPYGSQRQRMRGVQRLLRNSDLAGG